jgi:hypothetical protein
LPFPWTDFSATFVMGVPGAVTVAMAELAPMSVKLGTPVPSFATSCQRVWLPRWKPMPFQLKAAATVSVVASAAIDP